MSGKLDGSIGPKISENVLTQMFDTKIFCFNCQLFPQSSIQKGSLRFAFERLKDGKNGKMAKKAKMAKNT